jgi:hypothetical protein
VSRNKKTSCSQYDHNTCQLMSMRNAFQNRNGVVKHVGELLQVEC